MLFSQFQSLLDRYTTQPRQIILAFSGGVDSRVMLDLLACYRDIQPQHQYLVLHVHHGLSLNADRWAEQCQLWAHQADFDFVCMQVSVQTEGESLEQAAREARYQAIAAHMKPNALVLTGQHADDQAETFLLALKRGSGPAGLAAMPEIRAFGTGQLLRPLLTVSREQIEHYAHRQGLNWVEDESNLDCRFDRNFIRQQWLPMATARWPGLTKAINRTASLCQEQEMLLDELLMPFDLKIENQGRLDMNALASCSASMQPVLIRRWLKRRADLNLTQAQLKQIILTVIGAEAGADPKLRVNGWEIRRFANHLYLVPQWQDITTWQAALKIETKLSLPQDLGYLHLTAGLLADAPSTPINNLGSYSILQLKKTDEAMWVGFDPQGISAHPLGRCGKRKLKKLFQEYAVPSWLRRRTPLIFYGDKLAAVAGLFVCQEFAGDDLKLAWQKS